MITADAMDSKSIFEITKISSTNYKAARSLNDFAKYITTRTYSLKFPKGRTF